MSVNIACSVPECKNPVIGQCTGYKKNCGKYYCHAHSSDTLCADCTNHKLADEQAQIIYKDYLETAEGLEKEARKAFDTKAIFTKGAKIVGIGGLVVGLIAVPVSIINQTLKIEESLSALMIVPLFALYFYTLFLGPVIWIYGGIRRGKWHSEVGINRAKEMDKSKQGFLEFYTTWRKEKSKEKLTNILAVAGVIAAIGVAAVASSASESEYDRTRRAVRDELNSK